MMMWGMGWMMLGMAIFWLVLIVLAFLLIKALFSTASSPRDKPAEPEGFSPLETLELRYSRGEITREQFLQMKKDLNR